jgi:coenzyme F420-dependent glucose-6-phosphate dehydrogenase
VLVLGYKASTEQFGPGELLDWCVEAERCGFDAITASDHFHPWRDADVHCFFVWSWLGALGERTRSIRFGAGVTCPTFRYNPAVIAQASATLGAMYPGRFWLGLGTGEALNEKATTGCWPEFRERQGRLVEAIHIIRRLWGGERVTYQGRYFQTRDAHLYLQPAEPIPLYIGASGTHAARVAGRYGDGWMTTGGAGPVDDYRERLIPAVDRGAREARRAPTSVRRVIELAVVYAKTRQEGLEQARLWASSMTPNREKYGIHDPRDLQRYGALLDDKTVEQHWFISDDPAEHVALAEKFIQLGFSEIYFHAPGPRQPEFIQFYGQHVLPRLRQKYGAVTRQARTV